MDNASRQEVPHFVNLVILCVLEPRLFACRANGLVER
jgi:hypothetical protein